jgi:hypothetical protein
MGVEWQPVWQALRIEPPVTSTPGDRSPQATIRVVQSLDVTRSRRYLPRDGYTWCNIFVWDFTVAMCCEVPHWWDPIRRVIVDPHTPDGQRMRVNDMYLWLHDSSIGHGWRLVGEQQAIAEASGGNPVLAIRPNPVGSGHVSILRPDSQDGLVRTAQAGESNWEDGPLGFSGAGVEFVAHD